MRKIIFGAVLVIFSAMNVWPHCQIPCGIFDDGLRISLLKEHTGTISKSINQINELQKQKPVDYNQLVRWITNKEEHANEIQEIVTLYFMAQRINKPDPQQTEEVKKYNLSLSALHEILVLAMKAKQNSNTEYTDSLLKVILKFEGLYMGKNLR